MSTSVENLFVFDVEKKSTQNFIEGFISALSTSDFYVNETYTIIQHLPFEEEDNITLYETGIPLTNLFEIVKDYEYGFYFTLKSKQNYEEHGFSLQLNNLDDKIYLVLDWLVTEKNLQLNTRAFLLKLNTFLHAKEIYSSVNWLGSACFANTTISDVFAKSEAVLKIK